jgi:hypothetical protein
MNLLDHRNVRAFRVRCGSFIPGTNDCEQVHPHWSPPKVLICSDDRPDRVEAEVSRLFGDPDIHVVAVSPVSLTATPEIGNYSGNPTGVWQPHFAVTVIYQERLPVAQAPPAEPAHEAA